VSPVITLVVLSIVPRGSIFPNSAPLQSATNGPEVRSFLELMRHEQDELDFQIKRNEISRSEYLRAKNKIAIERESVLSLVKQRGQDEVPEIHVVVASELDQLIETASPESLKHTKPGEVFEGKWRYIGRSIRGEVFYIFERLTSN